MYLCFWNWDSFRSSSWESSALGIYCELLGIAMFTERWEIDTIDHQRAGQKVSEWLKFVCCLDLS